MPADAAHKQRSPSSYTPPHKSVIARFAAPVKFANESSTARSIKLCSGLNQYNP